MQRGDRQCLQPTRTLPGSDSVTHLLHLLFKCREHFAAFGKGVLEFFKLLRVESKLQGETGLQLLTMAPPNSLSRERGGFSQEVS